MLDLSVIYHVNATEISSYELDNIVLLLFILCYHMQSHVDVHLAANIVQHQGLDHWTRCGVRRV